MHMNHKNMFVQFQVHKFKLFYVFTHFSILLKNRSEMFFFFFTKKVSIELQISVNTDFKYFDKAKQTALHKSKYSTVLNVRTL